MKPIFETGLTLALSPLLIAQSAWVIKRAQRLPEPTGPRSGKIGTGPDLRLLVIGDSSAAGVGVQTQDQALTPQLARHLSVDRAVSWHLAARNGATSADAPGLLDLVKGHEFDVVFVIFGVNDTKNLRRQSHWRRDVSELLNRLRSDFGAPKIFVSGLPPIRDFPLLPNPLRSMFAWRAARFDKVLKQITVAENCAYLPIDVSLNSDHMAKDGFHPGPKIYTQWAELAAPRIRSVIMR
ncbi:MAG: SGNH/GDSL hydrolase family protein [Paracoccaceae bacterium]